MLPRIAEPSEQKPGAALPDLSHELENELVQIFKLLSDKTRLRILLYLEHENELHVTALCDKLGQSQPAVSHHLALLRVAGLIEARRVGKHNYYSVRKAYLSRIIDEFFGSIDDPGKADLTEMCMPEECTQCLQTANLEKRIEFFSGLTGVARVPA